VAHFGTQRNDAAPLDAAAAALDELDWMVGSWKDASPGVTVATTVDWTKGRHFLRRSISVTREDADPMEATEVIGYDPVAGGLHSWVFDSGAALARASGRSPSRSRATPRCSCNSA
jgi:hypothetical protein